VGSPRADKKCGSSSPAPQKHRSGLPSQRRGAVAGHLADDGGLGREPDDVAFGNCPQAVVDALKEGHVLSKLAPRLGLRFDRAGAEQQANE
jgi:hypothetical protein